MKKPYGKLIGASLGPGDPELITRRSWAVLQSGARWIYPVKKARGDFLRAVHRRTRRPAHPGRRRRTGLPDDARRRSADQGLGTRRQQTVELLAEGRDLVFLVEGDASTFATFGHLARVVHELVPDIEVETIPGVSSFTAAAAATGMPLAEEDETLAIIPPPTAPASSTTCSTSSTR
jgi:precorrin-2/cobalt-factor-2 C20-methyltransferase